MRVGVIRGDMPGPVTLMDLEPVSQHNPPTEPSGQERLLSRPNVDDVDTLMADVPAGIQGTTDVSGGITITVSTDDDLRVRLDGGDSFTVATVAAAVYADGDALITALNSALDTAGIAVSARLDDSGQFVVLYSDAMGPGTFIEIDSTANGSNFNGAVGFTDDDEFTVPTGAVAVTALSPVGGPLALTEADFDAAVGAGATDAQNTAIADLIAPRFHETDVAIKSVQVGMVGGFAAASYNPDPNRLPAIADGAAVEVVSDDGTAFTAPLTVISSATADSPNAGDLTIAGTNLGSAEYIEATVVKVLSADGTSQVKLFQSVIESTLTGGTQGSVTATSIVIPASLLAGLGVADSTVQVQFTSLASDVETVA